MNFVEYVLWNLEIQFDYFSYYSLLIPNLNCVHVTLLGLQKSASTGLATSMIRRYHVVGIADMN